MDGGDYNSGMEQQYGEELQSYDHSGAGDSDIQNVNGVKSGSGSDDDR